MIKIPDFVYPKDEQGNALCPRCRKTVTACDCPSYESKKTKEVKVKPKIRLEKSGRQGKAVTVVDGLPRNESYLKDLAKKLKARAATGGTFYLSDEHGVIELQGDHRPTIEKFFS